jgi:alpha-L-fucosidase
MTQQSVTRREFLKASAVGVSALAAGPGVMRTVGAAAVAGGIAVPAYLRDHRELYQKDPRQAAREWFAGAKFGLFMHYGLYSLLGRGEWVMLRERIPIEEYEKLQGRFTAKDFDVDFITDLALEAGMKYINLTARHHDGFCLFATKQHSYHSMAAPARRDLIGDLAQACNRKGLGLFLYYSYAADWWHPYFYPREAGWLMARPAYPEPPAQYQWRKDEDFRFYVDYVHAQLRELLTSYGPIAGIWFDPVMGFYQRPDLFPMDETYALVRSLQPHVLISFKQGATGTEDFAAPERRGRSLAERLKDPKPREIAHHAWESNKGKHNEICDTLQPSVWGYKKADDNKHLSADQVVKRLEAAWAANCNLLMNTGPCRKGRSIPTTSRPCGRSASGSAGAVDAGDSTDKQVCPCRPEPYD